MRWSGRSRASTPPTCRRRRRCGAAPVRRNERLLRALAERVGDERPVAARGVLLVRGLLRDPASPLYSEGDEPLARTLSRVLGALDP